MRTGGSESARGDSARRSASDGGAGCGAGGHAPEAAPDARALPGTRAGPESGPAARPAGARPVRGRPALPARRVRPRGLRDRDAAVGPLPVVEFTRGRGDPERRRLGRDGRGQGNLAPRHDLGLQLRIQPG